MFSILCPFSFGLFGPICIDISSWWVISTLYTCKATTHQAMQPTQFRRVASCHSQLNIFLETLTLSSWNVQFFIAWLSSRKTTKHLLFLRGSSSHLKRTPILSTKRLLHCNNTLGVGTSLCVTIYFFASNMCFFLASQSNCTVLF